LLIAQGRVVMGIWEEEQVRRWTYAGLGSGGG
jgi:hypothetical protein